MNLPEEMETALSSFGGLERLQQVVPDREDLVEDGKVFNALSDPIRLQIMHALMFLDLCPCLLKEIVKLSDSKLSYHLNSLEAAGLITHAPRKRWRIYMLTEKGKSFVGDKSAIDGPVQGSASQ